MPNQIDAKSFHIFVRLGNTPQFQIAADERVGVNPSEMKYRTKGIDTEKLDVLRDFVAAVMAGYPEESSIKLCVDGTKIVLRSACGN